MSTVPSTIRGIARTALVGGQRRPVVGSTARALLPALIAGLRLECDGLGRSAVILEPARVEPRVGDADLIAVRAVDQAARAAGADQVVRARR